MVGAGGRCDPALLPEALILLDPSRFGVPAGLEAGGAGAARAVRGGFDRRGCPWCTEGGERGMATQPVVVGVDGSENSKEALKWAVEFGRRYDTVVEATAVWQIPVAYGYRAAYLEPGEEVAERTRQILAETVRETVGEEAGVVENVLRGIPAETLVELSESAQLLVLGTRGHGAFSGMLLGSVSQHCVTHSKCPFVVIPGQKDKARGKDKKK